MAHAKILLAADETGDTLYRAQCRLTPLENRLKRLITDEEDGAKGEVENIIERAVVIAREDVISLEDLPFREVQEGQAEGRKVDEGLLRGSIEELERKLIAEAMENAGEHQTRAAEALGISERMLRYKLKKYGLKSS